MNDFMIMAKCHLSELDQTPLEISRLMAGAPMSALGMNSPDRAFRSLRA
jgi:hypothetical protein